MKAKTKPVETKTPEPIVTLPVVVSLYGVAITTKDDNIVDEWYVDANGVVFTTNDIRTAKLQANVLNRRNRSHAKYETRYTAKEIK
jgi:hypothetical protein